MEPVTMYVIRNKRTGQFLLRLPPGKFRADWGEQLFFARFYKTRGKAKRGLNKLWAKLGEDAEVLQVSVALQEEEEEEVHFEEATPTVPADNPSPA